MKDDLSTLEQDLGNWKLASEVATLYPQFTVPQLKRLIWKRNEHRGLSRCYKRVGKRGYINLPLFGMYMAGTLPEQQEPKKIGCENEEDRNKRIVYRNLEI